MFLDIDFDVYVLGKDTPNKLKFAQMLGGKETGDGNSEVKKEEDSYVFKIRNIPEEDINKITRSDNPLQKILIFYVYNVDDRETFEKYEKIHQVLKKVAEPNWFILYGINSNIERERSVSREELITTALKTESFYFELQEFDKKYIGEQLNGPDSKNKTTYIGSSEELLIKKSIDESLESLFGKHEITKEIFIPMIIDEMKELEIILDEAIDDEEGNEERKTEIYFIYSPYRRETFTAIKYYFSKCSNLQNYNKLPISIIEDVSEDTGEEKEVTNIEVMKYCFMKEIKYGLEQDDIFDDEPDNRLRKKLNDEFFVKSYDLDKFRNAKNTNNYKNYRIKSRSAEVGVFKICSEPYYAEIYVSDLYPAY